MSEPIDRRRFLGCAAAGAAALSAGLSAGCNQPEQQQAAPREIPTADELDVPVTPRRPYRGPNVVLVRFGGGVRRRETILDPDNTWCPFVTNELVRNRGVLVRNVEIESGPGIKTSHGEGTLYLLTGQYDHFEDIERRFLSERFEARVPTLFEYLRRTYDVPDHQALILNGEDRLGEEFYTFSSHARYGSAYRGTALSLYRFKVFLDREELRDPGVTPERRRALEQRLRQLESIDYRDQNDGDRQANSAALNRFWASWRSYYGRTGLVNPRGDRALTALALRALRELRPRLMMINYNDPDYVHWGNRNFYTRAISVIDDGVRQIWEAAQADPEYRDNTVFLIVPDCGRDDNRTMAVPFQHHFNSRSAHEVFLVAAGPGIAHPRNPVTRLNSQVGVVGVVGSLMNIPTPYAEAEAGRRLLEDLRA
jgi:hypothetical protein